VGGEEGQEGGEKGEKQQSEGGLVDTLREVMEKVGANVREAQAEADARLGDLADSTHDKLVEASEEESGPGPVAKTSEGKQQQVDGSGAITSSSGKEEEEVGAADLPTVPPDQLVALNELSNKVPDASVSPTMEVQAPAPVREYIKMRMAAREEYQRAKERAYTE